MNTCIILVLKSTLGRRLGKGFIDHVIGALVDLFNSCQLHISCTRYIKISLRCLIKEKVCHCLPGDIGGRGIRKKVTNGDIGGGGSNI